MTLIVQKIARFLLFFLTLVACKQATRQNDNPVSYSEPIITEFIKGDEMDKNEFWKIIDYSMANSNGNRETQEKLILEKLLSYTLEDITSFEIIFRQLVIEADDFKIMGAEKIIEGWVMDDSYLYFRCWLIGQGQRTFEEALKDPDYLANIVSKGEYTNFEELMYVATKAYSQISGKEEDETFPRGVAIVAKELDYDFGAPPTKGTDWTEDQLPSLYPKLWAKFH